MTHIWFLYELGIWNPCFLVGSQACPTTNGIYVFLFARCVDESAVPEVRAAKQTRPGVGVCVCVCVFWVAAASQRPRLRESGRPRSQKKKKKKCALVCFFSRWPPCPNGPACVSQSAIPGGRAAKTINAPRCIVFAGWPRRPNGPAYVSQSAVPGGRAAKKNERALVFLFCWMAGQRSRLASNAQQKDTEAPRARAAKKHSYHR